jgi:hypothetical protein
MDAFERDYGIPGEGIPADRIGRLDGDYLAVMRDGIPASFESRSLPIYSLTQPYRQYMLAGTLPEGWTIEVSEVAPAFGREGGALQVLVLNEKGENVMLPDLDRAGLLK